MSLNINSTECLVKSSRIGEAVVTNICTGEVITVPWYALDWLTFSFMAAAVGLLTIGVVGLAGLVIVSIRDGL